MGKNRTPHDSSYRRLFSHARMVEDLLQRYVSQAWISRLDFSTLEMVPAHYVSDELRLPREKLEPLDNPVAGVFQLEQSTGVDEIRRIIDTLIDVLDDPELRELRRDMATWIRRAVLPARLPGVEVPEIRDLQEAKIMLAERAATWPQQWMAEGYDSGRAEGYDSGLVEGRRVALIEQIEEKFGQLEPRFEKLVAEASEDQLKRWAKVLLNSASLNELFRI